MLQAIPCGAMDLVLSSSQATSGKCSKNMIESTLQLDEAAEDFISSTVLGSTGEYIYLEVQENEQDSVLYHTK